MTTSQKLYLVTFLYFFGLILFETAQQHFYITSFNLDGSESVSFFDLLQNHFLLWIVWAFLAIPLTFYALNHPLRKLDLPLLWQYGWRILLTLLGTLLVVSLLKLWLNGQPISAFREFFSFYTFQKAALFINAYLGIVVFINLYQSFQLLDAKVIELSDLSDRYQSLHQDFTQNQSAHQTPLIQIKIGNKVKNILLSKVIWVQADDYCVKVHTQEKTYLLRKSMKAMELELNNRGFIRVHRNSIVNKEAIDTIIFTQKPHLKLKNGQSIPIANSRIATVKARLNPA